MDVSLEIPPDGGGRTGGDSALALPDGCYHLSSVMDDALRGTSDAPPRGAGGHAHPVFAFVVALGGLGIDIATICARLDLPFNTGAMLGRCCIRYDRPLLVDSSYEISGHVVSITRKPSRRFTAADHVRLAIVIHAQTIRFATVELVMIVPIARTIR